MTLGAHLSELISSVRSTLDVRLFELHNTPITIYALMVFLLTLFIIIVASMIINKWFLRRFLKRLQVERSVRHSLVRLAHYVFISIGTILAFQLVGFDLSGLAVIFGFLSVGIGFGMQNITSNFIAGLILMAERPIKIGDRVTVGGNEGDVIAINMRATLVRTTTNIDIIVPNSEFISSIVTNWSHGDKMMRLTVPIGVSYNSDLDLVFKALDEVIEECGDILAEPKPEILFKEFGDSSWNLMLRVWIPDLTRHTYVRSDINCAIVRKFAHYKIEIPFPQRDVHMRSPLPAARESSSIRTE